MDLEIAYSTPNIVKALKSRNMRWVKHVPCTEKMKNAYRNLMGKWYSCKYFNEHSASIKDTE
jgi:hypothetical protein